MTAKKAASTTSETVSDILEVTTGELTCYLVGTSPLIHNRLSNRAQHELLMPKGKKNAAEKATTLKHHPTDEFRASAHILNDEREPTYLGMPSTAFKGAIRTAALDMPGAKKAQIGRLTYITGTYVNIYGLPKLFMSAVRQADMNRTPDIRTRTIIPAWACKVVITFVKPLIRPQAVTNLLAAAGICVGVGDWRPEKGSGYYGQFKIVAEDDPTYHAIVNAGGRQTQIDAMDHPVCYNDETTELYTWFTEELARRQLKGVA